MCRGRRFVALRIGCFPTYIEASVLFDEFSVFLVHNSSSVLPFFYTFLPFLLIFHSSSIDGHVHGQHLSPPLLKHDLPILLPDLYCICISRGDVLWLLGLHGLLLLFYVGFRIIIGSILVKRYDICGNGWKGKDDYFYLPSVWFVLQY